MNERFTTADLIQIRQILDRYMHHNCSISSSAYKEVERLIDLLTDALITPSNAL